MNKILITIIIIIIICFFNTELFGEKICKGKEPNCKENKKNPVVGYDLIKEGNCGCIPKDDDQKKWYLCNDKPLSCKEGKTPDNKTCKCENKK